MSKELEALETLKRCKWHCSKEWIENYPTVENALKRLEQLEVQNKVLVDKNTLLSNRNNELKDRHEQDQKKLKALEIIKKKMVDVGALQELDLELYNKYVKEINGTPTLPQKEYELLKEVLL